MPRRNRNSPDLDQARQRLRTVHERLCQAYGCPVDFFSAKPPLDELVAALLSHRTRNPASTQAYHALKRHFADWTAVRDAPTGDVEAAIAGCTWPEQKAPRIQQVLREITARRGGELSLDFLTQLSVPQARAWLTQLPGVGPKTSAAVLLFSRLRMPALPVDSHHHRVAARLAIVPDNMAVGPAHAWLEGLLPSDWSAQQVYDHHELLMFHGQKTCHFTNPDCRACCVNDICPTGQERLQRLTYRRQPPKEGLRE